jgi:hypothetical protein
MKEEGDMFHRTVTTKKRVAVLAAVAALTAVPMAQAFDGPPDAIDRYNNPAAVWDGPPDAMDRYRENQQLATLLVTRPGWDGPPDAIDRYLGRTATAPVVSVDDSFAWSEFGIGAGVMLGAVLLLAGISLGALLVRHRGGELRTS